MGLEFLTSDKWIGFDKELLSVTIHPEDEEAFTIWNEKNGRSKRAYYPLRRKLLGYR